MVFVASGYFPKLKLPASSKIIVSTQYWEIFGSTAESLVREFEAQNPSFRIVMAKEQNQDIVFFDDSEFSSLVENSSLVSLIPYMYTETEDDLWALPLVSFVDLFFYNIDILQMAGNDRPPRTRAELLTTARSVAQMNNDTNKNIFPLALGLCETDTIGIRRDFYPWVWALGAQIHSGIADDGILTLTAQTTNTINFIADMNREGLIAPGTFETTGRERLQQFAEGKIAMMVASARDIPFFRNHPHHVNFDIGAVPATTLGRNRLGISGIYAGISADSTQPDEAWNFLVFMSGRINLLAAATGAVPGSFFINFPDKHIEEDEMLSKAWEIFDAAEIAEFNSSDLSEMEAGRIIRERLIQAFAE